MLLAIDTSTRSASLAVHDGSLVRAEYTWQTGDHHTVELMPRIVDMMNQSDVRVDQLSGLVVALGPGSFTCVRVGVALAKGLALSRGLPMVGIRSTDVIACAQPMRHDQLTVVLQAGRGRLIAAHYDRVDNDWRQVGDFVLTNAHELGQEWIKPMLLCGELAALERESIARRLGSRVDFASPAMSLRRAGFLAELGWNRIRSGRLDDPARLQPIYVTPAALEGAK